MVSISQGSNLSERNLSNIFYAIYVHKTLRFEFVCFKRMQFCHKLSKNIGVSFQKMIFV